MIIHSLFCFLLSASLHQSSIPPALLFLFKLFSIARDINVAKGWLSTSCSWDAAFHTHDLSWKKMDVEMMMMMNKE